MPQSAWIQYKETLDATLQFGSYLGEKKMWQQMLSSNCSIGHVSPWGPAEVLLCLRIKNIYGSVDRNDQSFCLGRRGAGGGIFS